MYVHGGVYCMCVCMCPPQVAQQSPSMAWSWFCASGINVLVTWHCLQWLSHDGRMSDDCLLKQLLLGELLPTRPAHGPWRDLVLNNIQSLGFNALNYCFNAAQDQSQWSNVCQFILSRSAVSIPVVGPSVNIDSFACGCGKIFCRSGDLTCHRQFCGGQPP